MNSGERRELQENIRGEHDRTEGEKRTAGEKKEQQRRREQSGRECNSTGENETARPGPRRSFHRGIDIESLRRNPRTAGGYSRRSSFLELPSFTVDAFFSTKLNGSSSVHCYLIGGRRKKHQADSFLRFRMSPIATYYITTTTATAINTIYITRILYTTVSAAIVANTTSNNC